MRRITQRILAGSLLPLAFMTEPALSEGTDVCVRNYRGGDVPGDACEISPAIYVVVQAKDETREPLCTMRYPDAACEHYPREYRRVVEAGGGTVCVVDFNQPGVGNYCQTNPDLYDYAQVAE